MATKLKEVIIVDDDPTTTYLNLRIVSETEIAEHITTFKNGKEALDYLLQKKDNSQDKDYPELMILDHHMPVMDGLELMEMLNTKGMLDKMRTVILLLAIHTNPDDMRRFKKLGVQEFTTKPLSKETLSEAYQKYWANNTARNHNHT